MYSKMSVLNSYSPYLTLCFSFHILIIHRIYDNQACPQSLTRTRVHSAGQPDKVGGKWGRMGGHGKAFGIALCVRAVFEIHISVEPAEREVREMVLNETPVLFSGVTIKECVFSSCFLHCTITTNLWTCNNTTRACLPAFRCHFTH